MRHKGLLLIEQLAISDGYSCIARYLTTAWDDIVRHWREAGHGMASTRQTYSSYPLSSSDSALQERLVSDSDVFYTGAICCRALFTFFLFFFPSPASTSSSSRHVRPFISFFRSSQLSKGKTILGPFTSLIGKPRQPNLPISISASIPSFPQIRVCFHGCALTIISAIVPRNARYDAPLRRPHPERMYPRVCFL